MADTATFSAAMKEKFIGPIRDNLHSGKVLLYGSSESEEGNDGPANPTDFQGIRKGGEDIAFTGNGFRIPLKKKRGGASGFRNENDRYSTPLASEYTYLEEPCRYQYGTFSISGPLMKAAEGEEGSFKSAFKAEMDDTLTSCKIDKNIAAWGNGSGVLATIRATEAAAQTVISVDSTVNFRTGEIIDGVTIATGVVIEPAREVVAVDRPNRTITVSPALTTGLTQDTDGWVRSSPDSTIAAPNNSWNKVHPGLDSIVDSAGTLHGVSPTTTPLWSSYERAVGGAITDTVIRTAKDEVGFESGLDEGGPNEFVILTTRGIRRRYADTLVSVKRFNDAESVKLHGGFTAVMFDESPIFTDDHCPVGRMYGLRVPKLFWAELSDWDWMDQDGGVLARVPNHDGYQAVLYKYDTLGTTQRNAHFKLTGITDDVK